MKWTLKKVCVAKGYFCNLVTHSLKRFAFSRLSCRESFRRWTPCQRWRPLRGSTCRPHPVAFMSHQLTVGTDTVNSFRQSCSLLNLLHASLGRHNGIHLFRDVQPPGRLLKGCSAIASACESSHCHLFTHARSLLLFALLKVTVEHFRCG